MKHIRLFVYSIVSISSIIGMDTQARMSQQVDIPTRLRIELSKENLPEYQAKFDEFVERRKGEADRVHWIVNLPFGKGLGSFFSGVDLSEADLFLQRVFENEEALKQAAQNLGDHNESIAYLQTVLNDMKPKDLKKKKSHSLAALMKKHRHPALSKNGREMKPWDKNEVDDTTFYRVAACSFMAYVIVEEGGDEILKEESL